MSRGQSLATFEHFISSFYQLAYSVRPRFESNSSTWVRSKCFQRKNFIQKSNRMWQCYCVIPWPFCWQIFFRVALLLASLRNSFYHLKQISWSKASGRSLVVNKNERNTSYEKDGIRATLIKSLRAMQASTTSLVACDINFPNSHRIWKANKFKFKLVRWVTFQSWDSSSLKELLFRTSLKIQWECRSSFKIFQSGCTKSLLQLEPKFSTDSWQEFLVGKRCFFLIAEIRFQPLNILNE